MRKKGVCPECGRKINTCNFVLNKLRGLKLCKMCNNRVGSNKFYTPIEKGSPTIEKNYGTKHYIDKTEEKVLKSKFAREGMKWESIKKRLERDKDHVKKIQKDKNRKDAASKKDPKKMQERLVAGLK